MSEKLMSIYDVLFEYFGEQDWWPGDTRFEVIVGAILTQNTAWQNVEVAIRNLKDAELLSPRGLLKVSDEELERCVRPAGYYRIKTKRLKSFINLLFDGFAGDLDKLFSLPLPDLRSTLLDVNGIGPETADSIILYAGGKPSFVVDAYTKRIFGRIGILNDDLTYDAVKTFFEDRLLKDVGLYNEFHALIVMLGKNFCKSKKPLCKQCPLVIFCNYKVKNGDGF
ncbi:MAG: endonuclease III domain-containing protein [Candidatus Hydrothermarchaeales archaeon]